MSFKNISVKGPKADIEPECFSPCPPEQSLLMQLDIGTVRNNYITYKPTANKTQ